MTRCDEADTSSTFCPVVYGERASVARAGFSSFVSAQMTSGEYLLFNWRVRRNGNKTTLYTTIAQENNLSVSSEI